MKIYIAGRITGTTDYMERFAAAEERLRAQGHIVLSPTAISHFGLQHHEYMCITYAMIAVTDKVYLLKGWHQSLGARAEKAYAETMGKEVEEEC